MLRCSGFEFASVPSTLMPVPLAPRPLMRGLRPVPISTPGAKPQDAADIAASERQFSHLLRVEGLRLLRRCGADQRRHALDTDRLADRADFERESLANHLTGREREVLAFELLESGLLNAKRIGPKPEKLETKFAGAIADR